jgi:hypothetical protein
MEPFANWLATLIGAMSLHWFVSQIGAKEKTTTADEVKKKVSLVDFVEDNHKLITTLGVFTALTVFVSNLPLKTLGYLLSFLFLTGTVLVWSELWSRFPKPGTNRLIWFENVLSVAVLILVAYWVLEFRVIWRLLLTTILMLTFLWFMSLTIKRFNLFEFLFRIPLFRHNALRYLVGVIVIGIALILAAQLANFLAQPINALLDELRQQIDSITMTVPLNTEGLTS